MILRIVLLATLTLVLGLTGFAQSKTTSEASGAAQSRSHFSPQTQTILQLANAVSDAFTESTLGNLDAGRPYVGSVRLRIEYMVDNESRSFKTLAAMEKWLKSKEIKDGEMTTPRRNVGKLLGCQKAVCTFEPAGGLHGILYLHKITYGMVKGRPYIKAIHLVND
jgi:hypothetical protein